MFLDTRFLILPHLAFSKVVRTCEINISKYGYETFIHLNHPPGLGRVTLLLALCM